VIWPTTGLEPDEAVELAYENVIEEAKAGMCSVRKPFEPVTTPALRAKEPQG
jgi:hypothetical protein